MEYKLCYIDGNKAWFTSNFEHQWGDDWNDVPYEHNAEPPYDFYYKNEKEIPIELKVLFYDFPYEWVQLPCDNFINSPYSVEAINRGVVPWIVGKNFVIQAGTALEEFKKIVKANKGKIYTEEE